MVHYYIYVPPLCGRIGPEVTEDAGGARNLQVIPQKNDIERGQDVYKRQVVRRECRRENMRTGAVIVAAGHKSPTLFRPMKMCIRDRPRVMADDPVTPEDLAALGQGGLCLNCPVCTYPNCGFGKGM